MNQNTPTFTQQSIHIDFWCIRVQAIFDLFSKDPSKINHLLLYGPPGSGKTTAAHWLVDQIWGVSKPLMCMSMNAADERSLDSIRQKATPFFKMDWRSDAFTKKKAPRFLILDECETLTDPAQLSLINMCDSDPTDLCLILICNSSSRINQKLRQRLLKVRFDPPLQKLRINTTIYDELTRGDLRISNNNVARKNQIIQRLWNLVNGGDIFCQHSDFKQNLIELLIVLHSINLIDEGDCQNLNVIYSMMENGCFEHIYKEMFMNIVKNLHSKIESLFAD